MVDAEGAQKAAPELVKQVCREFQGRALRRSSALLFFSEEASRAGLSLKTRPRRKPVTLTSLTRLLLHVLLFQMVRW